MKLRDYQRRAIDAVREQWDAPLSVSSPGFSGRGIGVLPATLTRPGSMAETCSGGPDMAKRTTPEESFPTKLTEPNARGCRLWTGSITHDGYGRHSIMGAQVLAHRFAWTITNGAIPDGVEVCHKCDVRNCCEPSHLFLGTRLDNANDMAGKFRGTVGEKNSHAVLTEDEVVGYRQAHAAGESVPSIWRRSIVTKATIRALICRRTWKYLD